jgi:hypothetical protein
MKTSESIDKIVAALSAVQGATVVKASSNPHFKSKYADLSSCIEATVDTLKENGLVVLTLPGHYQSGVLQMVSTLLHTSGQWMQTEFSLPLAKPDPQGFGGVITYARRYCLAAWCQLIQEDDDGNAASAPASKPSITNKTEVLRGDSARMELLLKRIEACETIDDLASLKDDLRNLKDDPGYSGAYQLMVEKSHKLKGSK